MSAPSSKNELQSLEKSKAIVKKYLEKLGERNGGGITLETLCELERKHKTSDSVLLPKNKKRVKKVDHSYSEKAAKPDLQKTILVSPVSHDPLLTVPDSQPLSLDSSVTEMELAFHSDILLQDYMMDMVDDLNPVEVMTAPLDMVPEQETVVVIIDQ